MANWFNPGIDLLTNWGKDAKSVSPIILDYSIEVKWLTTPISDNSILDNSIEVKWLTDGTLVLTDWLYVAKMPKIPKAPIISDNM